ncbi:hypothetical protein [Sulfurovum sp. NBC37-1]|uniref:hypothetical protein n=1 Tax=Sulfurovum sp. (strain NBC37-1) TaxID=387093 RepID=UPI0001587C37|nr:hypothetical protein [Sulfurovum sp. NBC37-1]BAF72256.1 hypothetical protein SUN_1303 [Sulfurovum sp. NBC37-1]
MKYISNVIFDISFESDTSTIQQNELNNLLEDLEKILLKYNINSNNTEYRTLTLNKEKYSITQCDKCAAYMINRDKNPIGLEEECFFSFVYNGGSFEGQELCEMCLPETHRWA